MVLLSASEILYSVLLTIAGYAVTVGPVVGMGVTLASGVGISLGPAGDFPELQAVRKSTIKNSNGITRL
ncbi:MAG: hypothetical protein IKO54_10470 [Lachnospiraceae bacterium]|nr:hypothetical protein [Lachnospiraceae bacterium]